MKRTHTPLLIVASALTIFVGALYAYMFNTMSMSVIRAGAARDVVATEQHDQNQAKTLASLVLSTLPDRTQLSGFFISSNDIVSFITTIEALGRQSGTKVVLASIDADQMSGSVPGSVAHAKAHVDGSGSWAGVMKLLALAEALPYASNISHVRIDQAQDGQKSGTAWSISFDVQALVLVASTTPSTNH